MKIRNTVTHWGAPAKLLHWLVVFFIIGQYVLANIAEDLPLGMEKISVLARHKSVGITILALAVLRVLWRFANPTPQLPTNTTPWQRRLAQGTHVLLYGIIFAMPLSGWAMSSAKNYPVSWFGVIQLPDFVTPSESLFSTLKETHEALATALLVLAALHVAGALKHQFIDKDGVLRRMLHFH